MEQREENVPREVTYEQCQGERVEESEGKKNEGETQEKNMYR
jgi:hypothetical protein